MSEPTGAGSTENEEGGMAASKFRKKPVEIEAIRVREACRLAANDFWAMPQWLIDGYEGRNEAGVKSVIFTNEGVHITTLEGTMLGGLDDWIIRGVQGELYPCKPDIFEATYDAVEDGYMSPDERLREFGAP